MGEVGFGVAGLGKIIAWSMHIFILCRGTPQYDDRREEGSVLGMYLPSAQRSLIHVITY